MKRCPLSPRRHRLILAVVVLLVAVLHVATPAALALHATVDHDAHATVDYHLGDTTSDRDDPNESQPCDLCRHLSTVAAAPAVLPPVASVLIDVTSVEHAFAPARATVAADAERRPAAPRAPPVL